MACVIVLGCYRSGTSAVAGALHHLGVFMGESFDPPAHSNPKGFFEDLEFKDLFNRMADGKTVDGLFNVLIRRRDLEYKHWGFKDPQACLFLPRILSMFKDHRVISTLRLKEGITDSLHRAVKGATAREDFLPLIDHYLQKKDETLAVYDGPVLEVEFERLIKEPADEVERIASFVSLPVKQAAIDFITKGN